MFEIVKMFITKNRPYTRLYPTGITLHETASPGGTALNHYKYFNSKDRRASAHAFVDWESIIQTIPWDEIAWHAGRTANKRYIGIELCRPKTHDVERFDEVWRRGVWLFAYLFVNVIKIRRVTNENLISHYEVTMKWRETNHVDPITYFKEYNRTVDDFRRDVQEEIDKMLSKNSPPVLKRGVVTAIVLNVREGGSLRAKVVGKLKRGIMVNIYDEFEGWYLIDITKPRWVCSRYVKITA